MTACAVSVVLNTAVHERSAVIVTVPSAQSSSPIQPTNVDPLAADAVKVTTVPETRSAVHVVPHDRPTDDAVTVPVPVP